MELHSLNVGIGKLETFISIGESHPALHQSEKNDLEAQVDFMNGYAYVLARRIARLSNEIAFPDE